MSYNAKAMSFDFGDLNLDAAGLKDIEVLSVSDALALPETGASSASSSCTSSSCCGSSSCFTIN